MVKGVMSSQKLALTPPPQHLGAVARRQSGFRPIVISLAGEATASRPQAQRTGARPFLVAIAAELLSPSATSITAQAVVSQSLPTSPSKRRA
jgi:hypothetical protein